MALAQRTPADRTVTFALANEWQLILNAPDMVQDVTHKITPPDRTSGERIEVSIGTEHVLTVFRDEGRVVVVRGNLCLRLLAKDTLEYCAHSIAEAPAAVARLWPS